MHTTITNIIRHNQYARIQCTFKYGRMPNIVYCPRSNYKLTKKESEDNASAKVSLLSHGRNQ